MNFEVFLVVLRFDAETAQIWDMQNLLEFPHTHFDTFLSLKKCYYQ